MTCDELLQITFSNGGESENQKNVIFTQTFLLLDEKNTNLPSFAIREKEEPDSDVKKNNVDVQMDQESSYNDGLIISSVNAKWLDDQTFNSLENISLTVRPEQLVAIIGPVGAGKV